MPLRRLWWDAALILGGLAIMSLWPLTAYGFNPVLLPAVLMACAALVTIAQRPEYGIALSAAIAPVAAVPVGGQRPLLLAYYALAIGLLAYGPIAAREAGWRIPGVLTAVTVFFVASVLSGATALEPGRAFRVVFQLGFALALMFATLQICRTRRQLMVVVGGVLAGLAVEGLHGVIQQATGNFSDIEIVVNGEVVRRITGAFGHPNQYAGFLAVFIPLAITVALSRPAPARLRVLGAVATAAAVPALVLSYTRGAVVGVVVGALVWLAVVRPRAALLVAVALAIGGTAFAPSTLKERFQSSSGGDVSLRSDIWATSLDIYAEHPLLGAGMHNFSVAYQALPSTAASGSQRRLLHTRQVLVPPHAQNLYLNVLAEQGLVGFLAFLLVCATSVAVAFRGSRIRDPVGRAVCMGIGAGLVTLAVHSLLDVGLFGERLEVPLFELLAVAATLVAMDRRRDSVSEV